MATVPEDDTKTDKNYYFLLPKSFNIHRQLLMKHTDTGYEDPDKLNVSLPNYWTRSVLKGVGVPK